MVKQSTIDKSKRGKWNRGSFYCNRSGIGATEDPKIGFYFLVNSFSFSISLRVVGGGEGKLVAKKFS